MSRLALSRCFDSIETGGNVTLSFKAAYEAAAKQANGELKQGPSEVHNNGLIHLGSEPVKSSPVKASTNVNVEADLTLQKCEIKRKPDRNAAVRKINADLPKRFSAKVTYSPPRYNAPPDLRPKNVVQNPQSRPLVRLNFTAEPSVAWNPVGYAQNIAGCFDDQLGRQTNICQATRPVARDVVMGIDFGTSSTKVVLGDRGLKTAYAVPLTQMAGVSAYLIPSQLSETDGLYALSSQGIGHNDLKLSMLSDLSNPVYCVRVCAYLALVIRASQAWMFSELKDQYLMADVLWSVALGQPADQATSAQSKALFEKLGKVAWYLAGCSESLTTKFCLQAWHGFDDGTIDPGDLVILVMPELAAQIHGFVSSVAFDPKHSNIYLLVDVGAGTVDASVFKVRKEVDGRISFSFYTNAVEAYGAMNLHRHRVGWWQAELRASGCGAKAVADLEKIRLPTEYGGSLPEMYTDYIDGVKVLLEGGALSPDDAFFLRVRNQVAGHVLYGVWEKNLLDAQSIAGMPFFLCGGGARHSFYTKLKVEMKKQPNCSWLNAAYKELSLPSILRADGVKRSDYDRLSVAYGLSQLDLASVEQVGAMQPLVKGPHDSDWRSNYVDSSCC